MTKHILGRVFNFLTSSPFRQTGNVQLNKAQTLLSAKTLYGGFNEFESDLCSNEHLLISSSKNKIFIYLQVLVSTCMVVLISVPEELILVNYIFIKSTYN